MCLALLATTASRRTEPATPLGRPPTNPLAVTVVAPVAVFAAAFTTRTVTVLVPAFAAEPGGKTRKVAGAPLLAGVTVIAVARPAPGSLSSHA